MSNNVSSIVSTDEVPGASAEGAPSAEVSSAAAGVSVAVPRVVDSYVTSRGRVLGEFVTEEDLEILSRPDGLRQIGGRGTPPRRRREDEVWPGHARGAPGPAPLLWRVADGRYVRGRGRGRGRMWSLPELVNLYFSTGDMSPGGGRGTYARGIRRPGAEDDA